jgi:hypothetical protein
MTPDRLRAVRLALDHARAVLEEAGCDCGQPGVDPPCALCDVERALEIVRDEVGDES